MIAFIPLAPKAKLIASSIRGEFAARWPELPSPAPFKGKDEQIAFRVGESDVILQVVRTPIPWSDLEEPCRASLLWKDAEAALRGHTGHLIVTILSEEEPLEQATLLTQVCASVLATCPQAPGVFWSNAELLVPSGMFQDFARKVLPEGPPLHIWVDTRVGRTGQGKTSGFTIGMAALGHMEFETEGSPEEPGELRERFWSLAGYVLENGPVIRDGDTVGEDANERIQVVYAKSAFGRKGKVMRLEYRSVGQRRSWFGG